MTPLASQTGPQGLPGAACRGIAVLRPEEELISWHENVQTPRCASKRTLYKKRPKGYFRAYAEPKCTDAGWSLGGPDGKNSGASRKSLDSIRTIPQCEAMKAKSS